MRAGKTETATRDKQVVSETYRRLFFICGFGLSRKLTKGTMMNLNDQKSAPIYEALNRFRKQRVVPFDVPGHKRGRGNPELVELLGEKCVGIDVNSMKPLDNLCHPVSVIKARGGARRGGVRRGRTRSLMVGGTTSSVQSMILSACKSGDKIILPRNVHKSAINALVLCGAVPVYVDPRVEPKLGIPLGMEIADVRRAIDENPDAVAVLVNNPTYYGICSNLKAIVELWRTRAACRRWWTRRTARTSILTTTLPLDARWRRARIWRRCPCTSPAGASRRARCCCWGQTSTRGTWIKIINLTQTTSASYLLMSEPRHFAPQPRAARGSRLNKVSANGGIRARGDQRRWRVLCLRARAGQRETASSILT